MPENTVHAYALNPTGETLLAMEPVWRNTIIDEAISNLPAYARRMTTMTDPAAATTYVLAEILDEQTEALIEYATWVVSPISAEIAPGFPVAKCTLVSGHYMGRGNPDLGEAVADLCDRANSGITGRYS